MPMPELQSPVFTENRTKAQIGGDYSDNGINISFKSVENGAAAFYAPFFNGEIAYILVRSD
jgi:hypothetical protein